MVGLNGQRVADLSELSFDVYLEEGDSSVQPYLVVKIDGDGDGSIDTTFSYRPGPIELDTWTLVDAINSAGTRFGRLAVFAELGGDVSGESGRDHLAAGVGAASR